jgi:protocatechuate 3,4-dioxygenase, beta subunit
MHRRLLLKSSLLGAWALSAPSALLRAAGLAATPQQARGPFYPNKFPAEIDNDLTAVAGGNGVAHGDITLVSGKILDQDGNPLAGVRIEIWQVNGYGRYHHEGDDQDKPIDPNFQGYGTATSGEDGGYSFKTVRPIAYPGRAPHIHFALKSPSGNKLVTQMYIAGAPENEQDFLLSRVRDKALRDRLIVPLEHAADGDELRGAFDIVM